MSQKVAFWSRRGLAFTTLRKPRASLSSKESERSVFSCRVRSSPRKGSSQGSFGSSSGVSSPKR